MYVSADAFTSSLRSIPLSSIPEHVEKSFPRLKSDLVYCDGIVGLIKRAGLEIGQD